MKKQDINIYREIKRNTEMAIKALDAVTDKIYDERLAATVADQELQYSRPVSYTHLTLPTNMPV